MAMPFPGMDPFLEVPSIWRGFHGSLAEEIKRSLNSRLAEKYYADIEIRIVTEEITIFTAT